MKILENVIFYLFCVILVTLGASVMYGFMSILEYIVYSGVVNPIVMLLCLGISAYVFISLKPRKP